jgi:hypothetical protein
MTKEIAQKDWPAFCRMISEKYHDAHINIQLINGRVEKVAQDAPLKKLVWDEQTDACNNMLVVQMEALQYEVVEPIHFILRKPKGHNGTEKFYDLEILAENGTTVITIHPGIAMEHLTGI